MVTEIVHDVCESCHPEHDITVCGLQVEHKLNAEELQELLGNKLPTQDCVVCEHMACPTCPEYEIGGKLEDD